MRLKLLISVVLTTIAVQIVQGDEDGETENEKRVSIFEDQRKKLLHSTSPDEIEELLDTKRNNYFYEKEMDISPPNPMLLHPPADDMTEYNSEDFEEDPVTEEETVTDDTPEKIVGATGKLSDMLLENYWAGQNQMQDSQHAQCVFQIEGEDSSGRTNIKGYFIPYVPGLIDALKYAFPSGFDLHAGKIKFTGLELPTGWLKHLSSMSTNVPRFPPSLQQQGVQTYPQAQYSTHQNVPVYPGVYTQSYPETQIQQPGTQMIQGVPQNLYGHPGVNDNPLKLAMYPYPEIKPQQFSQMYPGIGSMREPLPFQSANKGTQFQNFQSGPNVDQGMLNQPAVFLYSSNPMGLISGLFGAQPPLGNIMSYLQKA